jgi:hypothetical protein
MLLDAGADVNAASNVGGERGWFPRGAGPSALQIVLDTGTFYGRRGEPLDRERLDIATMLVDRGAEVDGVADPFEFEDVMKFESHEKLWDTLRVGISNDADKRFTW